MGTDTEKGLEGRLDSVRDLYRLEIGGEIDLEESPLGEVDAKYENLRILLAVDYTMKKTEECITITRVCQPSHITWLYASVRNRWTLVVVTALCKLLSRNSMLKFYIKAIQCLARCSQRRLSLDPPTAPGRVPTVEYPQIRLTRGCTGLETC